MKISILTLFPEMFQGPFDHSIVKIAKEKKLLEIQIVDIRDSGIGRHKIVDDKPYGGGMGMIMRVDVVEKAIESVKIRSYTKKEQQVLLLDAKGERFSQKHADNFASLSHLILVCGHYEGIDERIRNFIDGSISIGNYVLTGGELPAMVVTDAVARLIPNVLKPGVTQDESFSISIKEDDKNHYLEHPQYTRPSTYKGLSVPQILLSGNHQEIKDWRRNNITKMRNQS